MKTPNLKPITIDLELDYANKLLGMNFKKNDVKELLEKMRYGVDTCKNSSRDTNKISVSIPAYRTDILHPIDLVEDIAIAYGYENFSPELPNLSTIGKTDKLEKFLHNLRELMPGFGFQEVMTLILTNRNDLFFRMNASESLVVEAKNPVSLEHSVARTWLLPSLMSVLEKNKNREYPQQIFEIGDCINADGISEKKLCGVIAHPRTNFAEIKSVVTGLLFNLGMDHTKERTEKYEHQSFMNGRCASTGFGFFGEIHPLILKNFNLELPVTAFELDLDGFELRLE